MQIRRNLPVRASERGVMLIEALVAILIFSIGILAVVGMQGIAIKDVTSAKYRSEAAFLAQQLISQMWTDTGNIATYAYPGTGAVPAKITEWVANVQKTLPDAVNQPPIVTLTNLTPAPPGSIGGTVQVTLRWRLPEEITQNLPAHNYTVMAYVYPAPS
ncbi:MAG TPA: type IV pilus modification protein PilV [Burkholderiales bacterium]|nr:type IV pilus modification protein PilV [Burkholderiales bacterium]